MRKEEAHAGETDAELAADVQAGEGPTHEMKLMDQRASYSESQEV